MSVTDLLDLDATALAHALRTGDTSPTEVLDATLDAAGGVGADVGAFTVLTADLARTQALAAESALVAARRAGSAVEGPTPGRPDGLPPFLGVPCPIKDLTMVEGAPIRAGSAAIDPFPAPYDDGVVTLLRAAGTVMIGKTTTPELGLPCYTEPDVGPTARTPWDLKRSAGGSSGGAAAAVAARVVPVAHGSDGGGSLRIPASACGLVGLKPSRGLVSPGPYGVDGAGLATHGVLTRSVRDAAAFLDVLARPWPGDTFTARLATARGGRRLRVGLLLEPVIAADAPVHPACADAARATAALLAGLGHDVVEIPPPFGAERWDAFAALWSVGALQAPVPPDREHLLVPLTRWLRERGRGVSGLAYATALGGVQQLTREVAAAWAGIDVVLSPTLAQPPALVGSQRIDDDPAADFAAQTAFTPWTSVWNLTGRPAISLPLGEVRVTDPDGTSAIVPVGVMLGADHGDDALLLDLAARLEEAAPWSHRRPGASS
ncbi:amidase [Cellulosimicrobium sp. I38E]|uniref:amidase n=1 Tax=Cellulosimicrobium sp. I38E TaxID=1393139 RepID=UPI0007B3123C|nr:amidase [Cellulosimicrobium sp. I38E]KZM76327.1 amidase [Cellulosimicrobium sp. I38E]